MTCERFRMPDGTVATVCFRGRKQKPERCSACGKRWATRWCDYPMGKRGKTCSAPLCERCAVQPPAVRSIDRDTYDLCPLHAQAKPEPTSEQLGLFASQHAPTPAPVAVPEPEEAGNAREALLRLLGDEQWHSFHELNAVAGVRYSARLLELKRLGWLIEDEPVGDGETGKQYRLTGRGGRRGKLVKAYLHEAEVRTMIAEGRVPESAVEALAVALQTFRANKDRL